MGDNRQSGGKEGSGRNSKGLIILLAAGLILAGVLLFFLFRNKDGSTGSSSGGDGGLTVVTTEQSDGKAAGEATTAVTEAPKTASEKTEEPSSEVTVEPASEQTEEPTSEKTEEPSSEVTEEPTSEKTEEPSAGQKTKTYKFRSKKLRDQHYEKHGKDMGFDTVEAYVAAANDVINDPSSLYKIEKEDGDDVYYRERDNAFVVVSKDGYLRTFFYPNRGKKYFDSQ